MRLFITSRIDSSWKVARVWTGHITVTHVHNNFIIGYVYSRPATLLGTLLLVRACYPISQSKAETTAPGNVHAEYQTGGKSSRRAQGLGFCLAAGASMLMGEGQGRSVPADRKGTVTRISTLYIRSEQTSISTRTVFQSVMNRNCSGDVPD